MYNSIVETRFQEDKLSYKIISNHYYASLKKENIKNSDEITYINSQTAVFMHLCGQSRIQRILKINMSN